MKGAILEYNPASGSGLISGNDGVRYTFKGTEFRGDVTKIKIGAEVDFEVAEAGGEAINIFPLSVPAATGQKNKIVAGLLAIFLGGLGIHKFYLGMAGPGVIMLVVWLFGWILFGIPTLIIGLIALIEGIIYLTKDDDAFTETYEVQKKGWF